MIIYFSVGLYDSLLIKLINYSTLNYSTIDLKSKKLICVFLVYNNICEPFIVRHSSFQKTQTVWKILLPNNFMSIQNNFFRKKIIFLLF